MVILLLPAILFMLFVGWCMYWTGDQKRTGKTQRKPAKGDNISILPIIYEEKQEITSK
jgi:hypothetical protein